LKPNDFRRNEKVAETDTVKATLLEEFFTSAYAVQNDYDFERFPSRIPNRSTHIMMHE